MTRSEIRQLFKDAADLDDRIHDKECEIANLKEMARSISALQISGMPKTTGYKESYIDKSVCNYTVEEQKLEMEKQELLRKKQLIYQLLNSLQSRKQRQVLRLRYLEGYTWKEVAEQLKCGLDNAYALHRKALDNIPSDDDVA